jgi:hypothetical protein
MGALESRDVFKQAFAGVVVVTMDASFRCRRKRQRDQSDGNNF